MLKSKRGSSLIYVVILLAILSVLATGFLYIVRFNQVTVTNRYRKLQYDYLARNIHREVCKQAENGTLEILQRFVDDAADRAGDSNEDEYSYYAKTGNQILNLSSGTTLTVRFSVSCDIDPQDNYGTARLDTYVSFEDGDAYQMSALFLLEDEAGLMDGGSRWMVERHYQTEEISQ